MPSEAELKATLSSSATATDREKEDAIVALGALYRDQRDAARLAEVITLSRGFMSSTAKAKTAKLIRTLLDFFHPIPGSTPVQVRVLEENIAWAKAEKRIFLKHSLETRLGALYLELREYQKALKLIDALLSELRRLDDKMILTEVHLLESRVYQGIRNFAKAKAALTSSRTAANSIYCPPLLQASLDLQSGILHAEDKDWTTSYSYFYEAFEGFSASDAERDALGAFKYMLLCKIMSNSPDDVAPLLAHKLGSKFATARAVEAMRAIAAAHKARDLGAFQRALRAHTDELQTDPTVRSHLAALFDTLLEQNLLRIIEPYGVVEVEYIAAQVGQSKVAVEAKLSQMILDKVLPGVLDQGRGCLLVYDEPEADTSYGAAIDTLQQVGKVVESLYAKTVKIA